MSFLVLKIRNSAKIKLFLEVILGLIETHLTGFSFGPHSVASGGFSEDLTLL